MKYVKILSLAAIAAAALMAFVGASTASATVLCKTTTNPCTSKYPTGTSIHALLKAGTTATLRTDAAEPTTLATCTASTVEGATTNEGSSTTTVDGNISTLTWGGCSTTVNTVTKGRLEVHYNEKGDGTVTAVGTEVTLSLFGVSCTYGGNAAGLTLGTLTEPATSTSDTVLDVNATPIKTAGGFLCPSTAGWTGEYTVTSPVPLYVAGS